MFTSISNIIFDLGGVILDIDFKKAKNAFKQIGLKEIDELFGLGHVESFFKDHEGGKISDENFLLQIRSKVNKGVNDEMIINAWNSMLLGFPAPRIQLLHQLRKKFRLFLFSNTNGIHVKKFQAIFRESFPGDSLENCFEKVYYSHLMGMRKPDKESFYFIIRENQLLPEQTLFIDDTQVNIDSAKETGLQTLLISPGMTLLDIDFFSHA